MGKQDCSHPRDPLMGIRTRLVYTVCKEHTQSNKIQFVDGEWTKDVTRIPYFDVCQDLTEEEKTAMKAQKEYRLI